MRLLGQLEQGVYIDDLEGAPLEDLIEFYGLDDDPLGSDTDDEDSSGDEKDNETAVVVPESRSPFRDEVAENVFYESLEEVQRDGIIPTGLGVRPQEWGEEGYPSVEHIRTGKRGGREIVIGLAVDIWIPRAVVWAQALNVLTQVQDMFE